jgi:beta-fructofuranosidase
MLPNESEQFGVKVCVSDDGREETVIYYDRKDKMLKMDTRKSGLKFGKKIIEEAPLELKKGEPLVLRVYVDKSIVEVYANNRQAIARRVYPTLGGKGISVFSNGGNVEIKSIKGWEIMPSNPY